jgi:inner membrane protein
VASPITHAFIGAALPAAVLGRKAGLPITLASIVCSISPDFDKVVAKLLEGFFAITLAPIWSHRGISHSFLFALILALLATSLAVRRRWSSARRHTLFLVFFFVTVSHGLIDVFAGTYGVTLLAPFSTTRYLHPIVAISSISFWQYFTPALGPVLLQEMLWIWLPFSALFVLIGLTAG